MKRNYISELKQILETTSMSQVELAKNLNVTFAALNRWINGHSQPRQKNISNIEKLYIHLIKFPSIEDEEIKALLQKSKKIKRKNIRNIIYSKQDLQDEIILDHTYNSNAIEGSTFTKRDTEAVIFQQCLITEKSYREHLEVTNYSQILKDIFQKKYPNIASQQCVCEIHKRLMHGLRDDAGKYSGHRRVIRGLNIMLTHPKDIPEEMEKLFRKWKRNKNKSIKDIACFHSDFELIHPFGDGNGRLGRLIMAQQCLEPGYPPIIIENTRKSEYYDVLEYAQTKNEYPLIKFIILEMQKTDEILKKYL